MAESQFYAILTDQGAALEATALATGIPVTLDKFVIGDGGGNAVTPDPTRTTLVNEVYRGTIQKAESQGNQVTFTLHVPPEAGGYTIREAGILTADGTLYSLSNSPDILKPTESNGAVISITFKYILAVSSTSTVTVVVYDNYLTPEAADEKYLQIGKNLSEIASNGDGAKSSARKNIGIDGDIAYRDKVNEFTSRNTFRNTVEIAEGEEALIRVIRIMYEDINNGYLSGQLNRVVKLRADGRLHLSAPSLDGLRFLTDSDDYEVYHTGNLNPVLSVNNSKPDANGNVKVSTGTTYSNSASKSANGWFRDSSTGIIRQWGIGALNTTINFPMAFPNACTSIQIAMLNVDPDDAASVHDMTSTSFKPYNYWGNSGMSVMWGADGY